jgi:hypothetical protein
MPAQVNLIDIERAKRAVQSITDNSQDALLGVLIAAYSDAVRKYCRRDFTLAAYDELYNGTGDRRLLLRQYPVASVEAVRYRPVTVLKVINNATTLNQQARVQVTSVGLKLTAVASGVTTTVPDTTLSYATNPTLNALAAAINAQGNGWVAQIVGDAGAQGGQGDYGLWPSADLFVAPSYGDASQSQGAMTARGVNAELKMHTFELQGYQWDPRGWLLRAIPYTDPELLHPEDLVWPVGVNNFRVQYTAGYAVIPEAVQEATALWVAQAYYYTQRDPELTTQNVPGQITQTWGGTTAAVAQLPPPRVQRLLASYRRHAVGTSQG